MGNGPWFIPPGGAAKVPEGTSPPLMRYTDDPGALFFDVPADDRGPIAEMSPGDAEADAPALDPIDQQAWLALLGEQGGMDRAPTPAGPRLEGDTRRQAYEALGRRADRQLGHDLDDLAGVHAASPAEEVAEGRVISEPVRQAQIEQGMSPVARAAKLEAAMAADPVRGMKVDPDLALYLEEEAQRGGPAARPARTWGQRWAGGAAEVKRAALDAGDARARQAMMDERDPMEEVGRMYTSRPMTGFQAFGRK